MNSLVKGETTQTIWGWGSWLFWGDARGKEGDKGRWEEKELRGHKLDWEVLSREGRWLPWLNLEPTHNLGLPLLASQTHPLGDEQEP